MTRTEYFKAELVLSDDEREQLPSWSSWRKSLQALALRACIVLACADGLRDKDVDILVMCPAPTVMK